MYASCTCTAPVMLKARRVVCAACDAPVLETVATAVEYTTSPGSWPPGARSRRAARARIQAVPGHEHPERGLWTVARALYLRRHSKPTAPRANPTLTEAQAIADEVIAAAGLRPTRRTA